MRIIDAKMLGVLRSQAKTEGELQILLDAYRWAPGERKRLGLVRESQRPPAIPLEDPKTTWSEFQVMQERVVMTMAMEKTKGNESRAAAALGMHRTTFAARLIALGIKAKFKTAGA